ncbi:MAG TPA: rRNA pseudouridine synthase [Candidatus Hydrogenedentes bacterium]|nr:rRNA pseudouridine synthase [Candidatus Hydrogenedentota bacterium]
MNAVRLQKFLAECGVDSRRACERLIQSGRVYVNGAPATLGQQVRPGMDEVRLDGQRVSFDEKIYVVFNKPANVITTLKDTHGRKTVADFLNGLASRAYPVGRLDRDVEGVLLFTNDGELAFRLIHPRFQVDKVYLAWVKGSVRDEAARRLEAGVRLEDGMTAPARIQVINAGAETSLIKLTIHEGRKREVKRMCAAVGHPVETLQRISFAGIEAKGLRPGEWRYLSAEEIANLRKCVGLSRP